MLDNLPVDVAKQLGAEITHSIYLETAPIKPEVQLSAVGVLGRGVSVMIRAARGLYGRGAGALSGYRQPAALSAGGGTGRRYALAASRRSFDDPITPLSGFRIGTQAEWWDAKPTAGTTFPLMEMGRRIMTSLVVAAVLLCGEPRAINCTPPNAHVTSTLVHESGHADPPKPQ
jgi:hypothetical protein